MFKKIFDHADPEQLILTQLTDNNIYDYNDFLYFSNFTPEFFKLMTELKSPATLTPTDLPKEFCVFGRTIDGDYLATSHLQTTQVIAKSLNKNDTEIFQITPQEFLILLEAGDSPSHFIR